MAQNTSQPSDNKLDELRDWALEFFQEETKTEEIDALYEWFEEYHRRQFTSSKNALILWALISIQELKAGSI